jgi:hypothetical protein
MHASLYACHHLLVNGYRSRLLRCRWIEAFTQTVPVHESRVTTVQNSAEPRACFEGASVDQTEAG